MIKKQILVFLLRWVGSSLGMYLCITWFGKVTSTENFSQPWLLYAAAGLVFSLVNSIVKPLAKLLVLPLAIVTMGISTIVINVAMVALTLYIVPGVEMDFWGMVASSLVLTVINSLVNLLMPAYNR